MKRALVMVWVALCAGGLATAAGPGADGAAWTRYPTGETCEKDFPNVESGTADAFKRLDDLLAR